MNGVQHKTVGIGFGIAGAYVVMVGGNEPMGAIIAATSVIGCMLPDIDHDKTKIGRKRKWFTETATTVVNVVIFAGIMLSLIAGFLVFKGFVDFGVSPIMLLICAGGLALTAVVKKVIGDSKLFKWATKHRGFMHTLIVPVFIYIGMMASDYPAYHYGMMGIFVGYISHLFADMLTVEGCPVLFPLTRNNIRIMRLKTKDKKCSKVAFIVSVLAVGVAYAIVRFTK